jgi:peroxiredoxin
MKKTLGILIFAAAAISALSAQAINQSAPAFSVKDLDGKTIAMSDLKGKIILINFWATWCPPCRAEIPDFVDFYNRAKAQGVEIIGLSVDEKTADQLKPFVQKYKMTYPIALATAKIIRDFQPGEFIPTTFLIDRKGIIRDKQVGAVDKATLDKWLAKLSAEK